MAKQVPKDETTVYKLLTLLRKNTNGVTYRELRDWAISRKLKGTSILAIMSRLAKTIPQYITKKTINTSRGNEEAYVVENPLASVEEMYSDFEAIKAFGPKTPSQLKILDELKEEIVSLKMTRDFANRDIKKLEEQLLYQKQLLLHITRHEHKADGTVMVPLMSLFLDPNSTFSTPK